MRISLIVAMDENNLIGASGGMPWHMPDDLRHFKRTTTGAAIVMGRKTHDSIGKPLPDRRNIILSRDLAYLAAGCETVSSIAQALEAAENHHDELMVIGGAQVYALALPCVERIYLTRIHATFVGDTWFPQLRESNWQQVSCAAGTVDADNPHKHDFIVLQRRKPNMTGDLTTTGERNG